MKQHKIVFLPTEQTHIDELWNPRAASMAAGRGYDVRVHLHPMLDAVELKTVLNGCEALITTWGTPVCTESFLLEFAPDVKIIGHAAGSVVAITDETTYDTGVQVVTANPVMAEGVSEWSLLATLLAARNLGKYTAWHGCSKMDFKSAYAMSDLRNLTVGIWGFGDTTRHFLKMLAPLRPGRILINSGHCPENVINALGAEKSSLETLLKEADIFHALAGVNNRTFERISSDEFSMMKEGAIFINCGRAHLVNEAAMLDALTNRKISAILDVFHREPLPEDSPLYSFDNVIMTPHNAGFPGRERFVPFIFDEFERFFAGKSLLSGINKKRFLNMTNERLVSKSMQAEKQACNNNKSTNSHINTKDVVPEPV